MRVRVREKEVREEGEIKQKKRIKQSYGKDDYVCNNIMVHYTKKILERIRDKIKYIS